MVTRISAGGRKQQREKKKYLNDPEDQILKLIEESNCEGGLTPKRKKTGYSFDSDKKEEMP